MTVHTVSIERLYHYRCCRCDTWFSVADRFIEAPHCPRCGYRAAALLGPVPVE